jgi:IS4 transposase
MTEDVGLRHVRVFSRPLALRLVAIRKPKPAIAETIARLKRRASKKGEALQSQTLIAAEWLILVTSLDAKSFPLKTVADLYRTRWRIEIAFKQLKSAAGLVRPPGEDPDVAKAHVLSHLLLILLTEPLLAEHLGVSPRRAAA